MLECFCRSQSPARVERAIEDREAQLAEIECQLTILAQDNLIFAPEIYVLCEDRERIEGEIRWLWLLRDFALSPRWRCALCPRRLKTGS
ncbi:hypothetical protein K2Z83_25885 [Oscillochloris sp. ZM17-4]|uniref:hypothetical protein n=1 Tax=Oscillochloris sp. ZM17-4 TaxID=2866714 RepID=UPI001C738A27|nr:hypothetical protein [Oscillochloris sp. ZM17-4]MBX0331087.1 hypothetical protein [Oscillochloris sp. ZM17-4]